METVKAAELVLDYDMYPRHQISVENKRQILEAMMAGVVMPPVVACRKTKRVVDGFHRTSAAIDSDAEAVIPVEWRNYKGNKERFLDAMRLNAGHGLKLTSYDRARCIVMSKKFGIDLTAAAEALSVTMKKLEKIIAHKTAILNGERVAIKRTLHHKAGLSVTAAEMEGNKRAVGHNQLFLINQVINLIESGVLDTKNEKVMAGMNRLYALLASGEALRNSGSPLERVNL